MLNRKNQSRIAEHLKSQATLRLRFLIVVSCILLIVFLVAIGYEIVTQQYKIKNYVATEAKILNSQVKKYSRRRIIITRWAAGTSKWRYKPQVEYSYIVAGRQYIANSITMINSNHFDENWAKEIVAKYRSGMITTTYYNPKNPQKSFLIYDVAFWPYNYALYGYFLLSICAVVYFGIGKIYNRPKLPSEISEHCYRLKPDEIKKTFNNVIVVCALYYLVGILLGVLYFSIADKPYQLFPQITYAIYFLLGLIPICYFGYNAWRSRIFQPPELLIDKPHLQRGEKVRIKVTQKFKETVELADTEIALVCTNFYKSKDKRGNDCVRNRDDLIKKAILCKNKFLMAGDLLEYEDEVLVPQNVCKSGFSEEDGESPTFYRWYFRITNTPVRGSAYTVKYFVSCE